MWVYALCICFTSQGSNRLILNIGGFRSHCWKVYWRHLLKALSTIYFKIFLWRRTPGAWGSKCLIWCLYLLPHTCAFTSGTWGYSVDGYHIRYFSTVDNFCFPAALKMTPTPPGHGPLTAAHGQRTVLKVRSFNESFAFTAPYKQMSSGHPHVGFGWNVAQRKI